MMIGTDGFPVGSIPEQLKVSIMLDYVI